MPLIAGDVKLPTDLSAIFSNIGTGAKNTVNQNYGTAMGKAGQDASAQGFAGGPLDYTKQRMGVQQGLDTGGIDSGLNMELGKTGYQNALDLRDYNQKKQISDMIGSAMSPSTLQEIMGGIGMGAQAAGQFAPFMGGGSNFNLGDAPFPQGDPSMDMGLSYPAYRNNPLLNGGGR